jgi:hypothetical protein
MTKRARITLTTPQEKVAYREPRPDRAGKRFIAGYFPEAIYRQLRQLSLDEGKTNQELLTEALALLFKRYGKTIIRP